MVSDDDELERLRKEAAELRDLVRALSAALARTVAVLPPEAALALARGADAGAEPPFLLAHWNETSETARADVASELALLWKRLPPRENA